MPVGLLFHFVNWKKTPKTQLPSVLGFYDKWWTKTTPLRLWHRPLARPLLLWQWIRFYLRLPTLFTLFLSLLVTIFRWLLPFSAFISPFRAAPFRFNSTFHRIYSRFTYWHLYSAIFFSLDSVRSCYVCLILDFRLFYIHTQFSTYKLTNELISQQWT